jgi:hypothetical protein
MPLAKTRIEEGVARIDFIFAHIGFRGAWVALRIHWVVYRTTLVNPFILIRNNKVTTFRTK